MATITERLAFLVSANADQAIRAFEKTANSADKELTKATKSIDRVGSSLSSIGARGLASSGVLAAGLFKAAQGAAEDQKAQALLATQLKKSTAATEDQIKLVEDYIDTTARATGVVDDKLRPAFQTLVRTTGSVSKSQELLNLALDVSAGTGKDVGAVAMALSKAYTGNIGALTRLGVPLDDNIKKSKDFNLAVGALSKSFAGQAATAADTFAGRMARTRVAVDEAKEELGYAFIPVLQTSANIVSGAANTFSRLNEATNGVTGAFAAYGTVGLGLASTTSLIAGQVIKMRTAFIDSEGSLTKLGKTAKGVGFALATLAISQAVFSALNEASGVTQQLNDRMNTLLGTVGKFVEGKGVVGDAVNAFASLANAEGNTLKFSHLWTDWGKQIQIAGTNVKQPIEDIDAAFNKLLKSGGAVAGKQLIEDLRKITDGLDHSSQQYKDNIMLIERYTARINALSSATAGLDAIQAAQVAAEEASARAAEEAKKKKEEAAAAAKQYADRLKELRKVIGSDFVEASTAAKRALEDSRKAFDNYASSVASSIRATYTFTGALSALQSSADAVKSTQDAVSTATDGLAAAQRRVRDTAWAVSDAELELRKARSSGDYSAVINAERDLTRAREDATEAQNNLTKANKTLSDATTAASNATAQAGKTFLDRLSEQAKTATDFGDKIQRLIALGISQDSLQLVLDAGAEAGGAIADELIAGGQAAVDQADALTDSVKQAAVRAGTDAASQYYSEGVTLATNLVNGIDSVIKKYKVKLSSKGLSDKQLAKLKKNFAVAVDFEFATAKVDAPELASGGIVPATRGGRLIRVAEAGQDEAIIPLPRMSTGGGENITININTGVGDPNEIGRQVVSALQTYQRRAGAIPIKVA